MIVWLAAAACGSSTDESATAIPKNGRLQIVLDSDFTNEIDDEFALAYAALSPDRLDIVAVHAAPYSLSRELVEEGAVSELQLRMIIQDLEDLGLDLESIPDRAPGPSIDRAHERATEMAELLGITPAAGIHQGSRQFLTDESSPVTSEAASNLVTLAKNVEGDAKLIVVATGALTNVASALILEPSIADKVIIVWTSAYPSFWPHKNASFNLVQDITAANVVLESGASIVYIPGFFVGEKLRVSRPEMAEYVADKGDVGDYLFDMYDKHPLFGDHHAKSKVLWDMVTIAYLIKPEWFTAKVIEPLAIDTDLHWTKGSGSAVLEVLDVDRDRVFKDFYDKLADHKN